MSFASDLWLNDCEQIIHPLNRRLSDCFSVLFLSDDGQEPHPYVMRSAHSDKALGMYYYAQPQEMAARAFEAIIQDQSRKNAFLVQGTKQSTEAKIGVYPDAEHRNQIAHSFFNYFQVLGQAVTQQTKIRN